MESRPRVLVTGCAGMFGSELIRCLPEGLEVFPFDHAALDLTDFGSIDRAVAEVRPHWILNAAAYTDVDGAESKSELAFAVNGAGVGALARAASKSESSLVHISTDYVFSGEQSVAYSEDDPTAPINVYGASKLAGEHAIADSELAAAWILRTSWLYGPGGKCFPGTIARLAQEEEELKVVDDQFGAPTLTTDLATLLIALVGLDGVSTAPPGIYHATSEGKCSWYDFSVAIVDGLRERGVPLAARSIRPVKSFAFPRPAPRPHHSTLSLKKLSQALERREEACGHSPAAVPRPWREALSSYLDAETAPGPPGARG